MVCREVEALDSERRLIEGANKRIQIPGGCRQLRTTLEPDYAGRGAQSDDLSTRFAGEVAEGYGTSHHCYV